MALAAVLSAMKELILNAPSLPPEQSVREVYIRQTYPKLSDHEAEDLAKIDPSKFKIYTNSIFSSERDLIQRNFAMTIEYLKMHWTEESSEPFNLFQLVKTLHKQKPWKSVHTVDLGRNFVDFVGENFKKVQTKAPFLMEIAEMELLLRVVRRSPDDEVMPKHSLKLEELSSMTVEAILNLHYQIPSCVEYTEFNYSLIAARGNFVNEKLPVSETIAPQKIYCALSRNRDALQRWTEYGKEFYEFLKSQERQKIFPVSLLAEKFLESADENKGEEELFKEFIEVVYRSIETGALVIR